MDPLALVKLTALMERTSGMPGFNAESSLYTSAGHYWSMRAGLQGKGTTIVPAQGPCLDYEQCSDCFALGPSIFSPGRKFCQYYSCRPTLSGGCRCQLLFRGFVSCDPFDDPVATE